MTANAKLWCAALVLLAASAGTGGSALAQANFDGRWSVMIITDAGNCDRAYTYPAVIQRGRIAYEGEGPVALSGHVAAGGQIRVTVSRGSQRAEGVGRLSRNSGSGTWRGRSPDQQCSGTWQAERRG